MKHILYLLLATSAMFAQGLNIINVGNRPENPSVSFTSATSATITHNLNTLNIIVECRNGSGATIANTISSQTVNAVTVTFTSSTGKCVVNGTGGVGPAGPEGPAGPAGPGGTSLNLTTTGTSGPATLSGSTLNIPQYSSTGGAGASSQLSDFTAAGTGTAALAITCPTGRCNVQIGASPSSYAGLSASCTLTGSAWAWVQSSGVTVGASSAPTCTGATGVVATGYPADGTAFVPLYRATFTTGSISAIIDDRSVYNAVKQISGASGQVSVTTTPTGEVVGLVATAATPGSYICADITVDSFGRITTVGNGTCGSGGGTPAGASGTLQFNNAGAFGGIANTLHEAGALRWNTTPVAGGNLRFGTSASTFSSHIGCNITDATTCFAIARAGASQRMEGGLGGDGHPRLVWVDFALNSLEWTQWRIRLGRSSQATGVVESAFGPLQLGAAANNAIQINTSGTRPACNAGTRGSIWYGPGGTGQADVYEACRKDAADAYAWVTLI